MKVEICKKSRRAEDEENIVLSKVVAAMSCLASLPCVCSWFSSSKDRQVQESLVYRTDYLHITSVRPSAIRQRTAHYAKHLLELVEEWEMMV